MSLYRSVASCLRAALEDAEGRDTKRWNATTLESRCQKLIREVKLQAVYDWLQAEQELDDDSAFRMTDLATITRRIEQVTAETNWIQSQGASKGLYLYTLYYLKYDDFPAW